MDDDDQLWDLFAESIATAHARDGIGQAATLWAVRRVEDNACHELVDEVSNSEGASVAYSLTSVCTLDGPPRDTLLGVTLTPGSIALAVSGEAFINPPNRLADSDVQRDAVLVVALVANDGSVHERVRNPDGSPRASVPETTDRPQDPLAVGMVSILLRHLLGLPLGVQAPRPGWVLASVALDRLADFLQAQPPTDIDAACEAVRSAIPMIACSTAWQICEDGRLISDARAAELIRAIAAHEVGPSALTETGRGLLDDALAELGRTPWTVLGATPGGQHLLTPNVLAAGLAWTGDDLTGVLVSDGAAGPADILGAITEMHGSQVAAAAEESVRMWWRRESDPVLAQRLQS